jgi:hypothetical protein
VLDQSHYSGTDPEPPGNEAKVPAASVVIKDVGDDDQMMTLHCLSQDEKSLSLQMSLNSKARSRKALP